MTQRKTYDPTASDERFTADQQGSRDASEADRLQVDLNNLVRMLANYSGGQFATEVKDLQARADASRDALEKASRRLDQTGSNTHVAGLTLSEAETTVLKNAYALRSDIIALLARLQSEYLARRS